MKITPQEISHVADLARLHMSREELEAMALQLDDILNYVAKLNELDTESVTPTTHAISIKCLSRGCCETLFVKGQGPGQRAQAEW
jgi:aspartyl-tRNA(Asn)/glutamyl-tRNA(Gln) amidotransferase subunit C